MNTMLLHKLVEANRQWSGVLELVCRSGEYDPVCDKLVGDLVQERMDHLTDSLIEIHSLLHNSEESPELHQEQP